jgi:hypothetical protein
MSSERTPRWLLALGGAGVGVVGAVGVVLALTGGDEERPPQPSPGSLVRDEARPVAVRAGDLDGDGFDEVVISSVSEVPNELGLSTPYLEVFDVRDGRWSRVFDATGTAPPGAGAPGEMLISEDEGFVSQSVQSLELVDFARDGRPEIVAGIANAGATAGPLELWILSMGDGGVLTTELYEATARGGEVEVVGDRLRFEFAVYRTRDPGCCPSRVATQTIGWEPETGEVEVLEQVRVPTGGE